jgi:glycosyltransferase involved in cell wall biosynthesis
MRTAFFTICAANYIAFARLLMRGVARHHPDAARYVILVDEHGADLAGSDFEIIRARELELPEFQSFCFRYDITELCTAIKPYAILALFERDFDGCIYLDPDVAVYGPLEEALAALTGDGQAALTPHRLTPGTGTDWPEDRNLLQVGAYNLGFLAVRRTPQVVALVRWWAQRLERECLIALERGLFVDQKWIDLWPSFCPGTTILRHPGYNVAYWNLAERKVERSARGYLVDGAPLVFFHFSGVMPHRRERLSRFHASHLAGNIGDANLLLQAYLDELFDAGHAQLKRIACSYSVFENGVPIPALARTLFRRDEARFPDPYRTVFQALQEPSPDVAPNPAGVVSGAAHELWRLRHDLHATFHIDTAQGQIDLAQWFVRYGCTEAEIDPLLARPVAQRLELIKATRRESEIPALPEPALRRHHPGARSAAAAARHVVAIYGGSMRLQRIWRRLPPRLRARARNLLAKTFRSAAGAPAHATGAARGLDRMPAGAMREGALLVGYPKAETGVGQALRTLAEACRAAAVPFGVFAYGLPVGPTDESLAGDLTEATNFNCNIFSLNADQWPVARAVLGDLLAPRYNILRPFWELAKLPSPWAMELTHIQEIWAPTRFVAGAFAAACSCPVEIMPVPVLLKPDLSLRRAAFGLPEKRFLFLFSLDLASFRSRKNPEAVIAAFGRAFPTGAENVGLVIKVHGASSFDDQRELLPPETADPRIFVIDKDLRRPQVDALTGLADCFVSLHRSEGFGFGMAEAMALGKPVIGTDYSGNTDFLTEATGFPVAYRLVAVPPGAYPGYEDQVWAEPDLEQAAWSMRQVAAGADGVAERAEAARRFMAEHHSAAAVGRRCRDRLVRLGLVAPGVP